MFCCTSNRINITKIGVLNHPIDYQSSFSEIYLCSSIGERVPSSLKNVINDRTCVEVSSFFLLCEIPLYDLV